MIVLKNARLVSYLTEDCPLETADIVIDGKEISGIYPTGTDFGDCEKVDLAGKTVLPGMIDLHSVRAIPRTLAGLPVDDRCRSGCCSTKYDSWTMCQIFIWGQVGVASHYRLGDA